MKITVEELKENLDYFLSMVKSNSIKIVKDGEVIAVLKAPDSPDYRYGDELIGFLPDDLTLEEARELRMSEI